MAGRSADLTDPKPAIALLVLAVTMLVVACSTLPSPDPPRPTATPAGTQAAEASTPGVPAPVASPSAAPSAVVRPPLSLVCNYYGHCRAGTPAFFGTGKVEFGLNYDRITGALIDKREVFDLSLRRFAWSASWRHEALLPFTWTVSRVLDDGNELLLFNSLVGAPEGNPEYRPVLVDRQRMRVLVDKQPGRYVMRFYSGTTIDPGSVLADGEFVLR